MTGFEVAGLVLAVVPLILEGLKAYPKTSVYQTVESFRRARKERREFASQLLLMHTELRFAMIEVFKRINISLTTDQRRELTATDNVGAKFFDVWNKVFENNSEAIEKAFEHTIEHIRIVLDDIVEVLTEIVKHTEIPYDAGSETLRDIIKNHKEDATFSIRKNLSKRFMFAKADQRRHELADQLREDIKLLKKLNKGQEEITKFIAAGNLIESKKSHAPFLDRVRSYSNNLYKAISNNWQCGCHKSPSVMLRLERRETSETKENIRFSLFLTFEHNTTGHDELWAFQEAEVSVDQK